ncbi:hypothetical protein ACVRIE_003514, partial [Shigella sonnei]
VSGNIGANPAFISPRIADRITDGGRNWLSFNWPSYRSCIRGVAA